MVFTDENGFSVRSFDLSASASSAPQLVHNPGNIFANIKMNEQKEIGLEIQNHGGSILSWSLKGANGLAGSSFSLANVFTSEHFKPLEKGSLNKRSGSPVSVLGGGPDYFGYSWNDSNDQAGPDHSWNDISQTGNCSLNYHLQMTVFPQLHCPSNLIYMANPMGKYLWDRMDI